MQVHNLFKLFKAETHQITIPIQYFLTQYSETKTWDSVLKNFPSKSENLQ